MSKGVQCVTVHSNVHTMETDWPSNRTNEGPPACLRGRRRAMRGAPDYSLGGTYGSGVPSGIGGSAVSDRWKSTIAVKIGGSTHAAETSVSVMG